MFVWCIRPVFESARRRPAAVPEMEGQSAADSKKADEKAKIHVGARTVIGREKAADGPLLDIYQQKASHRRCQRLLEPSENATRAL